MPIFFAYSLAGAGFVFGAWVGQKAITEFELWRVRRKRRLLR